MIRLKNLNNIQTCTSGAPEPSHALQADGLSREEADSTIKTGLERFTIEEEILTVVEMIPEAVIRIKEISLKRPSCNNDESKEI